MLKSAAVMERLNKICVRVFNPLNAELNPIRHLLTLVGAHHFVHVGRIRVNASETEANRQSADNYT
jgi:hypothetical protein